MNLIKTIKNNCKVVLFGLIAIAVCYTSMFCNVSPKAKVHNSVYASLSDTVKYVGMQTCKQCHAEIYNTFIETGMGKSFDVATIKKSSANFSHATIYDKHSDLHYNASWQNNHFMINEYRLNHNDTIHQHKQIINYIIGSGQHTNSHIYTNNGYLFQAPMTYYTQKGIWDLPPGFENGNNTRFGRSIGMECITCHNAYPTMQIGSENKYSFVANGIDCERCHGPGSVHVQQIQAGVLTDTSKAIDYSIVNPAKLPVNLQIDICQRCHIQGNAVLKADKSFFDFKPGMQLSQIMDVYMPVYTGQETEHIMASHAERLKMSKCYINTTQQISSDSSKSKALRPYKNSLTCITCHNPHVSVKVTGKEIYNRACLNCHQKAKKNYCTTAPVHLKAANNNCIKCHMPKSGTIDIPHVRVTDHYIAKPIAALKVEKIKQFITLACINNPRVDNRSMAMAYINYYEKFSHEKFALDSAASYLNDDKKSIDKYFNELIHLAYLKNDYQAVIQYNNTVANSLQRLNQQSYTNTHAWTCYRIGESYWQLQRAAEALPYFERAVTLAPYILSFQNKYGTLLVQLNMLEKAFEVFNFIVSEDNGQAMAWCNLGYVQLAYKNNAAMAKSCYQKSLTLNPDYDQAIVNMASLLMYEGNVTQAKQMASNYLKRFPSNQKVKQLLIQMHASL